MAEAQWDIPEDMREEAFDRLPVDMLNAFGDFFQKLNNKKTI